MLTPIEFQHYLELVRREKNEHVSLRMGQCYYNVLYGVSDFENHNDIQTWLDTKIAGTKYDCYHDDNKIGAFLERVYVELMVD